MKTHFYLHFLLFHLHFSIAILALTLLQNLCHVLQLCTPTLMTLLIQLQIKIPSDECVGVILDIFFDSTAKTLVIYREFWYFSRIFPTLFS